MKWSHRLNRIAKFSVPGKHEMKNFVNKGKYVLIALLLSFGLLGGPLTASTSGKHTLKVVKASGTYSDIDGIVIR